IAGTTTSPDFPVSAGTPGVSGQTPQSFVLSFTPGGARPGAAGFKTNGIPEPRDTPPARPALFRAAVIQQPQLQVFGMSECGNTLFAGGSVPVSSTLPE